jgi:formylglycine-generating enzyme required for sulfatase activity
LGGSDYFGQLREWTDDWNTETSVPVETHIVVEHCDW